jgi:hypothetical protein
VGPHWSAGEPWDGKPYADEYDNYLLKVASDLHRGGSIQGAVEYLLVIEREHMGLAIRPGQEDKAKATARAIQRDVAASA